MSHKFTTLVIVESPAKCKKIEGFLGPGYECIASFGHFRSIDSLHDIDMADFHIKQFHLLEDKTRQVEKLRQAIAAADQVVLATDDDREGEAIAWHLCDYFRLDPATTPRIVFHEITEEAICYAIAHPRRGVDMALVQAQQARQVLDLLVGFNISPLLWKCVANASLSAGRCQTPALRLVYENHLESTAGDPCYTTTGYFTSKCLPFVLNHEFQKAEEVESFLVQTASFEHVYSVSSRNAIRQPPEPLTTSLLQQQASNSLHWSPKDTMKHAQELYEGGFITYIRTDSKKYCSGFVREVETYVVRTYQDEKYLHPDRHAKLCHSTTGNQPQQQPHEAIRPVYLHVQQLPDDWKDTKAARLYDLIWRTALQSCLAPAEVAVASAEFSAYQNHKFRCSAERVVFAGFRVADEMRNPKERAREREQEEATYQYLMSHKQGVAGVLKKVTATMTLKHSKPHFTEARLIQLLEERGIGRPSTFASLVDKIQDRKYVVKQNVAPKRILCTEFVMECDSIEKTEVEKELGGEKNKLVIQPLGIMVIEFLLKHFESLFAYDYTGQMESALDAIAEGQASSASVCHEHWSNWSAKLQEVRKSAKKEEYQIDDRHTFLMSKNGPVIKETDPNDPKIFRFKTVIENIDMDRLQRGEYALSELLAEQSQSKRTDFIGKYEGHDVLLKRGRYGPYVEWGDKKKSLPSNRPLENITFQEVLPLLQQMISNSSNTNNDSNSSSKSSDNPFFLPLSDNLSLRSGKYGDYVYYKTVRMKKPMFISLGDFLKDKKHANYRTDKRTQTALLAWLREVHEVQ